MSMHRWFWPGLLGLLAHTAQAQAVDSVYTNLAADGDCAVLSSDPEAVGAVSRCPGVADYHLLVEDSDDRMSITVEAPDGKHYPLDLWQYVNPGFSTLGAKAEWRVTRHGDQLVPFALIVRFNAADPESGKTLSYLTVSKITPGQVCLTEIIPPKAHANEQARLAATRAAQQPCYRDVTTTAP